MTKPGRIPCSVPFCRRTAKADGCEGQEVICGKHWRMANKDLTRRYRALWRKLAPLLQLDPDTLPRERQVEIIKEWRWAETLWREIKRQAIERAMGV